MSDGTRKRVAELLVEHGRTFSDEAGFAVRDTPSALFKLLVLALLSGARIRAEVAAASARARFDAGLGTPKATATASARRRESILMSSGYARYAERAGAALGALAVDVGARYRGDLRALRREAAGDPGSIRSLVMTFGGIGSVAADVFMREVQAVWDEVAPFADERAVGAARALRVGRDARALAALVPPAELPRLVCALVRAGHGARTEVA